MKNIKKIMCLLLVAVLAIGLASCGEKAAEPAKPAETKTEPAQPAEPKTEPEKPAETKTEPAQPAETKTEWKWERDIEIMTPGGLGGGLDLTLRAFAPLLEKELGVGVVIDNRTGGGQVPGFTYAYSQPRDGYLFEFSTPSFVGSAAAGKFSIPVMEELDYVCNLVQADAMIFAYPENGKFTDLKSMSEYIKAHPGEVSCAIDTPQGVAGAALTQFCNGVGDGASFNWITSGSDDSITSVIAGDIDTLVANWTDCGEYVKSGDLIAICTLSEKQLDVLPDVPSSAEVGAPVTIGFFRGFFAFDGTPQEAIDAFAAAVHKVATTNDTWKQYLADSALNNDYLWDAATLEKRVQESYDAFKALME